MSAEFIPFGLFGTDFGEAILIDGTPRTGIFSTATALDGGIEHMIFLL